MNIRDVYQGDEDAERILQRAVENFKSMMLEAMSENSQFQTEFPRRWIFSYSLVGDEPEYVSEMTLQELLVCPIQDYSLIVEADDEAVVVMRGESDLVIHKGYNRDDD